LNVHQQANGSDFDLPILENDIESTQYKPERHTRDTAGHPTTATSTDLRRYFPERFSGASSMHNFARFSELLQ
jgi:hypothetical protein